MENLARRGATDTLLMLVTRWRGNRGLLLGVDIRPLLQQVMTAHLFTCGDSAAQVNNLYAAASSALQAQC